MSRTTIFVSEMSIKHADFTMNSGPHELEIKASNSNHPMRIEILLDEKATTRETTRDLTSIAKLDEKTAKEWLRTNNFAERFLDQIPSQVLMEYLTSRFKKQETELEELRDE